MRAKPINCVWVVDDDPLQVLILNRLLTGNPGVGKTKIFSGAKAAVEAFGSITSSELPDLVFLDLVMLRGDGWDFLDYLKKNKNKIARLPRVVVISSTSDDNKKRLKSYPEASHFLSKPIDPKELEKSLEDAIREGNAIN
jgi:CheY-like chemotaxis protein